MRRTPTVRTRFISWALLLAAAAAFCSLAAAAVALWSKAMAWTETTSPRLVSSPAAAVTRLLIWSGATLTVLSRRTATERCDTLPGADFTCSVTLPTAKLRSDEFFE
jgi:hypothetical protein